MSLELKPTCLSKEGVQPALEFVRNKSHHTSETEPATLEGGEEERCCGQGGSFWLSSWKNLLAEAMAGFGVSLPKAMHQGSLLATGSSWSFYPKPSFFLSPAGLVCQGHVPVPVPLPALPQASWRGSMSSSGTTVSLMENWAAISPSLCLSK